MPLFALSRQRACTCFLVICDGERANAQHCDRAAADLSGHRWKLVGDFWGMSFALMSKFWAGSVRIGWISLAV